MDSHEHYEQQEQATEYLFGFTGQGFDQNEPLLTLVQKSPTPMPNVEDSLTDSTLVQQSQSCENVALDLTHVSLPGKSTLAFGDSFLDHFPAQEMLDSDILGRASPLSETPWVFLPGGATFTQDCLQRMEPLLLPQSSFLLQDMSLIGQHAFTLPMSGYASYLHAPDFEHPGVFVELQDIVPTGRIARPNIQNTAALSPRLLEAERHIDPRSVSNLVDETMLGAHRGPYPVTPAPSSSAGLTVPSTQSALSCSSKGSRNTRRSLKELKSSDAVHDTKCPDCSKYYSQGQLS
jgi:hypothetical protein